MNKLFILCGMVFLGITSTPQSPEKSQIESQEFIKPVTLKVKIRAHEEIRNHAFIEVVKESAASQELDIASIPFEEMEESIALGFDTGDYLPENFDPYKTYVDLSAIPYLEEREEEILIGSLKVFLPEGFNPYASPSDFMDISYMEEEKIDLGFDTRDWLPEGFDAYSRDLDLDSIVYVEEEDLDLGFDTSLYLPDNFNPYSL
ncbi:hypothetical protein SAMN06265375_10521 [Muriicola jejuensis]|uniref:Uncharacterized protein n=1 Tax=Muriicola jejuensis TaxID=504488 RepID=A0A6P0UGY9_9FLAO|nr:hypothetical protein [Muriicola jejuensis]NER11730.1 hypothetical protein [Muriicola jejuensis]SMP25051.1 hypothetical protein SAMN06265375_10521 [Muriicola jejuensis]